MGTIRQKSANSVKRSQSQPRAKLKKKIISYWDTRKTLFQIAILVGCRQPTVKKIYISQFGINAVKIRSTKLYRLSKLGNKNPMFDKRFEKHHNWKGSSSDHKGYRTVVKPIWWTGKNKGRVFEHHVVYAKHHNMTYIPKGYNVHHEDLNKSNNAPNNLCMLTKRKHAQLHHQLKNV